MNYKGFLINEFIKLVDNQNMSCLNDTDLEFYNSFYYISQYNFVKIINFNFYD